jgi:CelD/BcsL family acetyltransferase involved in cellulose biosynthesis
LFVDAIESLQGLQKLEAEWRQLQHLAGTVPFTSWEWNVTWWRHLSRHSLVTSDRLFVRAIRTRSGQLVGVAPLMVSEYPARGPRLRCLRYFGADPNITEIHGPLIIPEYEIAVYDALLRNIFACQDKWDVFLADGIRADGAFVPLLHLHGVPHWLEDVPSFVLQLPATWEEFRSTRRRNVKESLRKCSNSLKRSGLVPVHRVATRGPELVTAIESFFRLHSARAGRVDTVRHPDVFQRPGAADFLRELCDRLSAHDRVRVFAMEIGHRVVAVRVAFVVGRSLYLYYSGYDPEYGKHSVMTSVLAEAIKYAIANGYTELNLSIGADWSKTRWSPKCRTFRRALVASPATRAFASIGYKPLYQLRAWFAGD